MCNNRKNSKQDHKKAPSATENVYVITADEMQILSESPCDVYFLSANTCICKKVEILFNIVIQ